MKHPTHVVINQPPPLADVNLFTTDAALMESVKRECAAWAVSQLEQFGAAVGTSEAIRWAFQANDYPPVLETHDRFGHRRDEVEFHPAWDELMRLSVGNGLHNLPWVDERPGAHVARAALMMLAGENEAGHLCPLSMTYSAVPVLRLDPNLFEQWRAQLSSRVYDARFIPHTAKSAALIGMGMTEKQGGSDVRANTTIAEPDGDDGYRITGHKWFCSAPMSDGFVVLAQTGNGLTCFFLPRWTPDGDRNAFHIQRLKRKLGNRSNASSEVEFQDAWARRIGEEGRGIATIMEMVQHTRLDCCIGSAALMRRAVVEALHHVRHRAAFGRMLVDQALMQAVLADLALESEAATLVTMRLARAFDARSSNSGEHAFARLATAVAKFWIAKRTPVLVAEALECLGGAGYVEESFMPRLYREAPLNSIWEGSGNVIALDVLRVIRKEPDAVDAVLAEIRFARGSDARFDKAVERLEAMIGGSPSEADARVVAESVAILLGASLVRRFSPDAVADGFLAARLASEPGRTFGASRQRLGKTRAILDRSWPG